MMPKVTVAIPSYNGVEFLAAAVESVLDQTFKDYEILICDHGSTDGSYEYLQKTYGHDSRIQLMQLEASGQAVHNWNYLTSLAKGEYFKLLCMDDTIAPTCLEEQVRALDANPTAAIAASRRAIIDRRGRVLIPARGLLGMKGLVPGRKAIRKLVRAGTNVVGETSSTLMRTEVLQNFGGWDNKYPYLIDQYNYARILKSHDLVAIPKPLATFRLSSGQDSVRMMHESRDQMLKFGAQLRSEGIVTESDEILGKIQIRKTVLLRRIAYGIWRRRL